MIDRIPTKLDQLVFRSIGFSVTVLLMVMVIPGCSYNSARTGTHKRSQQQSPIVYTNIAPTNPVQAIGSDQRDWGRKDTGIERPAAHRVQADVAVPDIAPIPPSINSDPLPRVSPQITNEPPFFFAIMEDGRWRIGGEDFQIYYEEAVKYNETLPWPPSIQGSPLWERLCFQLYSKSPIWNSSAAVVLVGMANGLEVMNPWQESLSLSNFILHAEPGPHGVSGSFNEFERKRYLEQQTPLFMRKLDEARNVKMVRFFETYTNSGEYDFVGHGFNVSHDVSQTPMILKLTNSIPFEPTHFLEFSEAEGEEMRQPGGITAYIYEYEADLVSPDTQVTMAKKYVDLKHLLAVEVTKLTIHMVEHSGTLREPVDFTRKVLLKQQFSSPILNKTRPQEARGRAGP